MVRVSATQADGAGRPEGGGERLGVSVITAVHDSAVSFLPAAAQSLAAQKVPLEWIVAYDGDFLPQAMLDEVAAVCRELVPETTFVASGGAFGPSVARTVALSLVRAPWVAVLDADDVWLPGGLDRLLGVARGEGVEWCAGLSVDVCDGEEVAVPDYLPSGGLAPGVVSRAYEGLGFLPFHGCAVVWRASLLWVLGGWPALPASENSALVLAASERCRGHYVGGVPVYGYRRHGLQTTSLPEFPHRLSLAEEHSRRRISVLRSGYAVG